MERCNVLVTGGARGIGAGIVEALAKEGHNVAFCGRAESESCAAFLAKLKAEYPGKFAYYRCDVSSAADREKMLDAFVADFGALDVLVNNAGIVKDGLLMAMKEEDFSKVVDVNLKGTFHCIRHAARQMIRQRSGRIVNMASVVGIQGNAGQANYAASKAGIIGLTKAAARELAGRGITVNAVAPGFIETDMTAALSEKVRAGAMEHIPLGSFGQPEDVAEAVAFLASEKAGYITGQVLSVDGGMAM